MTVIQIEKGGGEDPLSATRNRDIFVIGASAGGLHALQALFAALPADFQGSLFVVVHISADAESMLAAILHESGPLPVVAPKDGDPIEHGRIYVASPDRHMLLERDRIRIVRGPRENRHRPAIDPLFRSAACAHGPHVVGIVLTGSLDDGAAGLWAIKSCGGMTVVQDPADASFPDRARNARRAKEIDFALPVSEIGPLLASLAREPIDPVPDPKPPGLKKEVDLAMLLPKRDIGNMSSLGLLSPFTCPTCHGALWEIEQGESLRYRCHTGHAFSGQALLLEQSANIEESLYSALRVVEEKAAALRRLSSGWVGQDPPLNSQYEARARALDQSAEDLRRMLSRGVS